MELFLIEESVQIAREYLERTGQIDDGADRDGRRLHYRGVRLNFDGLRGTGNLQREILTDGGADGEVEVGGGGGLHTLRLRLDSIPADGQRSK